LDVFGSGIIGRLNATSTNNAYLGFASNGTNKWSAGNVQSDHRFRIFSEANSAELITILQTGEFGIGIANPTTKFHIDGGATALIANLDANVSVAKTLSFRSDNSNRINLEVSGTESGSNAGANFFIRRYSDAGALIDTPLTITRSTGAISLATTLNLSEIQASTSAGITLKSNGGTSVALFGAGGGAGTTLYGGLSGTSATFSSTLNIGASATTGKQLIVNQTGATGYFLSGEASGTELAYWYYDASTIQFSSKSATRALTFLTSDTERMRISSGGNLFVGTLSDRELFNLGGNTALINSNTYSTSLSRSIIYYSSTISYGLQPIANINFFTTGDAASAMGFTTRADAGNYAERLRISGAGNIGMPNTYNFTTSNAANLYIDSGAGLLYRSTSSIKYKTDIMYDTYDIIYIYIYINNNNIVYIHT
jgi:hypothetical protein